MVEDKISTPAKVQKLRDELSRHHNTSVFDDCDTMGKLVYENLKLVLDKDFKQSTTTFDFTRIE